MKVTIGILLGLVLIFFSCTSSHAYVRKGVLGLSTDHLSIPPTVEGPGFFLPDSHFYFLDTLKQHIRLTLAFTPAMKAQVYASIAGERLAELRFELAKNNTAAAEIALNGVRDNTKAAALALDDARLAGENVENEAGNINRQIKEHLLILDTLEAQATGEMKAAVAYTTTTMADAKAVVEDGMKKDLIASEVRDDISREVAKKLMTTATSAEELQADLAMLQEEATSGAQKALPSRSDAIQKVIGEDTRALSAMQTNPQKDTYQLTQQTVAYVSQIIAEAQKAADSWQKTKGAY